MAESSVFYVVSTAIHRSKPPVLTPLAASQYAGVPLLDLNIGVLESWNPTIPLSIIKNIYAMPAVFPVLPTIAVRKDALTRFAISSARFARINIAMPYNVRFEAGDESLYDDAALSSLEVDSSSEDEAVALFDKYHSKYDGIDYYLLIPAFYDVANDDNAGNRIANISDTKQGIIPTDVLVSSAFIAKHHLYWGGELVFSDLLWQNVSCLFDPVYFAVFCISCAGEACDVRAL